MKSTHKTIALLLIVFALGCSEPAVSPLEEVRIIVTVEADESGVPDSYTIVEFPDKTRRFNYQTWGESGDTFKARKQGSDCWGP